VFAHVVIGAGLLVNPREPLVASVWHIFLIDGPADSLFLEEVNDCRNILRNGLKRVSVEAKVVSTDGGDIVWLRGMSNSVIVSQGDALHCEELEVG
jgi:hypothetical protein